MKPQNRMLKAWWQAFGLVLVIILSFLAAWVTSPSAAWAKSYTMPKVAIEAQVRPDGSLHVSEARTFDFDGSFKAVWFTLDPPAQGALSVEGVSIKQAGDPESIMLNPVPFDIAWREDGGPSKQAYSVDSVKNTVYAFLAPAKSSEGVSGSYIVTVDYTFEGAVSAFRDVGELYWKYIAPGWAEDSSDVSLSISLPVPQGASIVPGENVRAWGHGPLGGKVQVQENGLVNLHVNRVASGSFAEVRTVFPVAWVSQIPERYREKTQTNIHLDEVLKEEQAWADQANVQRIQSGLIMGAGVLLAAILLGLAIVLFTKFGKEYKPEFDGQYWRDAPEPGMNPAVLARVMGFDKENNNQLTFSVLNLVNKGLISLKARPAKTGILRREKPEYYLELVEEAQKYTHLDDLDRASLNFLFDFVGQGSTTLAFSDIKSFAKYYPQEFCDQMRCWQGTLSEQVIAGDYFEAQGVTRQYQLVAMGAVALIAGVLWPAGGLLLKGLLIADAIIIFIISGYMTRRSRKGCEIAAKAEALRRWLKDFTALEDSAPRDIKVWGNFMVYALVLGVAKEAMQNLQTLVPEAFDYLGEDTSLYGGALPWWLWYAPTGGFAGFDVPDLSAALSNSIADSFSSAEGILNEASSGSGFGGGFSAGGGGGFGGFGGGGAR